MSEQQHTNEAFGQDIDGLSLPDAEQSWQQMKTLLDADERKRRIIPPVLFRSCAGWATLLSLLAIGTWFLLQTNRDQSPNRTALQPSIQPPVQAPGQTPQGNASHLPNSLPSTTPTTVVPVQRQSAIDSFQQAVPPGNDKTIPTQLPSSSSGHTEVLKKGLDKGTARNARHNGAQLPKQNGKQDQPADQPHATASNPRNSVDNQKRGNDSTASLLNEKPVEITDAQKTDTTLSKTVDTALTVSSQPKKKAARPFTFSAGIGLQQQIPFAGQTAIPYDYYGRKSSLSDYIPSAYLRLQKGNRWFVQGEFRYGAPQRVKEFSYSRQTRYDSSGNRTVTTLRLKKTYYHQLPLSFNYYLRPSLSIGAGAIYSRFYGAVTEREVRNRNQQTQAETITKQIVQVQHFTDSFLYRTQFHLLLQADYQWRRFSVGLRYTRDVQPYIRYTKPNGDINEEKNQTLQFLLRYRLWQSK